MARASSSGRTGRYEETLTADLTDLLRVYGIACDAYLADIGASATIAVHVWDLSKNAESAVGADFILVMRGAFLEPTLRSVRKLVLVQAKRQDWGTAQYAASKNHVSKAQAMLVARGSLDDCFFSYYHDETALSHATFPSTAWPPAHPRPPHLYFATAAHGAAPYLAPHPALGQRSAFIERSGYRQAAAAAAGHTHVPASWSWGAGIAGADYFIDRAGAQVCGKLPSVAWVASHGAALDDWLVSLADCSKGTDVLTDAGLDRVLNRVITTINDDEDPDAFLPSCLVEVGATAGAPRDAGDELLPRWRPAIEGTEIFSSEPHRQTRNRRE